MTFPSCNFAVHIEQPLQTGRDAVSFNQRHC
jgi:hypothetical protein